MISSGTARVLELLRDRRWHSSAEIEEVCRVTCHSRLADLRRDGHVIQKRRNPRASGRQMFSWRLTAEAEEVAEARGALVDAETGSSPLSVSTSVAAAPIQSPEPWPAPGLDDDLAGEVSEPEVSQRPQWSSSHPSDELAGAVGTDPPPRSGSPTSPAEPLVLSVASGEFRLPFLEAPPESWSIDNVVMLLEAEGYLEVVEPDELPLFEAAA